MSTLLHLTCSPRGDYSISRRVSAAAVEAWKSKHSDGNVIERDLSGTPMTFVDVDWIMGSFAPPETHNESHRKALALSDELIAELLSADTIVIGTPMYNFAVPAALKAWIDHIVRAGKTFSYTAKGPQGHLSGRKVVVVVASGGIYSAGAPMGAFDHEIPYLRHILHFIGISDVTFVQAGGSIVVAQREVSAEEFIVPFVEEARQAVG